ncbi:MAG TPA: PadR family transcriptional regulator [Bryobacteraceae bacterium]|nr:PadR family transcriptional regulator [Bryobacteraceae bacterium]
MARNEKGDLLPGTLEMLILLTLRRGPLHGYAIAQRIKQNSDDLLRVEEGSLYPALQRMLIEGWVSAEWSTSARNRRVRVYTLTPAGRKQLSRETRRVGRVIDGIARVMRPSET